MWNGWAAYTVLQSLMSLRTCVTSGTLKLDSFVGQLELLRCLRRVLTTLSMVLPVVLLLCRCLMLSLIRCCIAVCRVLLSTFLRVTVDGLTSEKLTLTSRLLSVRLISALCDSLRRWLKAVVRVVVPSVRLQVQGLCLWMALS